MRIQGVHISVIIASRDSPRLANAIASALGQEGIDAEVLLVGACGQESVDDDPRVQRILTSRDASPTSPFNIGARRASGNWLAFLDGDDRWAPDHLARMQAGCVEAGADFACSSAWLVDDRDSLVGFRSVPATAKLERAFLRGDGVPPPSALLVRRSYWQRAGGFDEWLEALAGLDLCIRWSRGGSGWLSTTPSVAARVPARRSEEALRHLREELHELESRYGEDARALGVRFGSGELSTALAGEHLRCGQRLRAVRLLWHHAPRRTLQLAARLAAVAVRGRRSRIAAEMLGDVPRRHLPWEVEGARDRAART